MGDKSTPRLEDEVRATMIANVLKQEGATCLADLIPRPYVVGSYRWEEPITYTGPVDAGSATFQYSSYRLLPEGEQPPEDSWRDLDDRAVTAHYFRILAR